MEDKNAFDYDNYIRIIEEQKNGTFVESGFKWPGDPEINAENTLTFSIKRYWEEMFHFKKHYGELPIRSIAREITPGSEIDMWTFLFNGSYNEKEGIDRPDISIPVLRNQDVKFFEFLNRNIQNDLKKKFYVMTMTGKHSDWVPTYQFPKQLFT